MMLQNWLDIYLHPIATYRTHIYAYAFHYPRDRPIAALAGRPSTKSSNTKAQIAVRASKEEVSRRNLEHFVHTVHRRPVFHPVKTLAIIACIHHETLHLDPANSGDHGDLSLRGFIPADNLVALGCSADSDDVWFDMRSITRSLRRDRMDENFWQTGSNFLA